MTRRGFLHMGAVSALAAACGPGSDCHKPGAPSGFSLRPSPRPVADALEWLVSEIEQTERTQIFAWFAQQRAAGVPIADIEAATFLATLRSAGPGHVSWQWHAMQQLVYDAEPMQRDLGALWVLDQVKDFVERGIPDEPFEAMLPEVSDPAREFERAFRSGDVELGEAALLSLAMEGGPDATRDAVWLAAGRLLDGLHSGVRPAQSLRALDLIGWEHADLVLRTLARELAGPAGNTEHGGCNDDVALEFIDANLERSARLEELGWVAGAGTSAEAIAALESFRQVESPGEGAEVAFEMLRDGVPSDGIWQGLMLWAAEFMNREAAGSKFNEVHALTNISGFRYGYESSTNARTQLMCLLQAVVSLPLDVTTANLVTDLEPIDDGSGLVVDDIFAMLGANMQAQDGYPVSRVLLRWLDDGGTLAEFRAAARTRILRKGNEAHWVKYPTAVFEEAGRLPEYEQRRLLASSLSFLPGDDDEDWERYGEALEVVESL